jgi:hypothetical protein
LDTEDGHEFAYQRILTACGKYADCPKFFPSDSKGFGGFDIADSVQQWMHTAEQISIGGRKQVLEDGPDVGNSESDSDHEDRGDELTGVYVGMKLDSQGRPVDQSHKLANDQANALRAVASHAASGPSTQVSRSDPPPVQEEKPTALSTDKVQSGTEDQKTSTGSKKKKARQPVEKSSQTSESNQGMITRSQAKKASGAGGLRPAVGSGQTDTCVADGNE